jgi:hypothetical protein
VDVEGLWPPESFDKLKTLRAGELGVLRADAQGMYTRWLPVEVSAADLHGEALSADLFRRKDGFLQQAQDAQAQDGRAGDERVEAGDGGAGGLLTITASAESEDRAGDLVLASGWDLLAYRRNPVVLWAHQHFAPPIGRSLRTWVDGKLLMATVEFAPVPFAQEVRRLYAGGFLRGVSVGFRAIETEARKSGGGRRGTLFRRQELLEISAAPVPLHPDTLAALPPGPARGQDGAGRGEEAPDAAGREEAARALAEVRRLWEEIAGIAVRRG